MQLWCKPKAESMLFVEVKSTIAGGFAKKPAAKVVLFCRLSKFFTEKL